MGAAAEEWTRCRPWIEDAIAYARGIYAIEDIEAGIAGGQYQFWPCNKSAAVTEVHQYPKAKFFHVVLAGGELEELRDVMVPILRKCASSFGCSRLTLVGRRGWERALKKQGWRSDLVCLDLPVTPELEQ